MMKIIFYLLCGCLLASAILSDEEEWKKFKDANRKIYKTNNEESHRYQIFKDNLHKIREHNEMYEKGESSFKMGLNKFSDLTDEEFKAIYGRGTLPRDKTKPIYE
ncbi:unnamed protein product [Ceutorhynchus assimilis]|uniref:Cathepsin propeptide inhibitor domain-containing protein n=1 Tax=Ceutorhynchus assimilis TaxID=467358 RepID=A0A9N9M978_9CUCU|nr:unnamed protein product [Ceutorhynchus assimilis]